MSLYDFDEHTSDSEEEDSADEEEELIAENLKPGKVVKPGITLGIQEPQQP